jgi:small conductance mechanosensitive channel
MGELTVGAHDLVSYVKPDSVIGALVYLVIFVCAALVMTRTLRAAVHAAMTRKGHVDLTTISFLQQIGAAFIWVIVLILYAHLIPVLRSMGTALLAGASVASGSRRRARWATWWPGSPSRSIDPFASATRYR